MNELCELGFTVFTFTLSMFLFIDNITNTLTNDCDVREKLLCRLIELIIASYLLHKNYH